MVRDFIIAVLWKTIRGVSLKRMAISTNDFHFYVWGFMQAKSDEKKKKKNCTQKKKMRILSCLASQLS